jgi:hypothetical protein
MTNITTAIVLNEPKPVRVRTVLRFEASPLYLASGAHASLHPVSAYKR